MNQEPETPLQLPPPSGSSGVLVPDRFSSAESLRIQCHRYLLAFKQRWWILALSLLTIGGGTVYYVFNKPPTYSSESILWLSSKLKIPGEERHFSEDIISYMGTQAELLKSETLMARAFERIRGDYPEILARMKNTNVMDVPFEVTVRSSPKNSVLELEAKGSSLRATPAFLNALMEEYLALKKNARMTNSFGAVSGITQQIHDVERQMQEQQTFLNVFGTSNNISYLIEQNQSAGSRLSKISEEISYLRTEYRLLESFTPEQVRNLFRNGPNGVSDTPLPGDKAARALAAGTAPTEGAYFQVLQQAELLRARRDDFAKVLRPTHSKMIKLNQELAGLEQLLKTLKTETGNQALAQVGSLKSSIELQIQNLEAQQRTLEANSSDVGRKLAEYERLKQDRQRSQVLYDNLIHLLQGIDLSNNVDQEPMNILAPASPAKSAGGRGRLLAAGMLLALSVGIGLVLFLESVSDRFASVNELSYILPNDVIGQIPDSPMAVTTDGKRKLLPNPELQHAFAESFRNLGSSFMFMFEDGNRPKTILLTSAVPSEGKSTVASNLAATLAQSGAKVLLIDADLRRSALHKIFGVKVRAGLRDVLNQRASLADAIIPIDLQNSPAGLSVPPSNGNSPTSLFLLPAGRSEATGAEAFLLSQMKGILKQLVTQYDYIIIDSAPVLATNDVMSIVAQADYVLMVVRGAYTSSQMVREAMTRLYKFNAKALGVVYNRAAATSNYYYRYSSQYYSESEANGLPVLGITEITTASGREGTSGRA